MRIPRGSLKTDWEVELGVVIGRTCRYIESDEDALAAVAGYMVCHDVSEREFQLERGGQWVKGKSCETFNPAGPWLVTADGVADPRDLELWLDVNAQRRQTGTTRTMIFGVAGIVRYLSQFMVLDPEHRVDGIRVPDIDVHGHRCPAPAKRISGPRYGRQRGRFGS